MKTRTFRQNGGKGVSGYRTCVLFCNASTLVELSNVEQFDRDVGISPEQSGYQRALDHGRAEKMCAQLEDLATSEEVFDLGAIRLFAVPGSVQVDRGNIHIQQPLDLIDGQHRVWIIQTILENPDTYPHAAAKLQQIEFPVTILVAPESRKNYAIRDKQDFFRFANKNAKSVAKSHQISQDACNTVKNMEQGQLVTWDDFSLAINAGAWDRMGKRRGWVWSNKLDLLGAASAMERMTGNVTTLNFSEMIRTTSDIISIIRPELAFSEEDAELQNACYENSVNTLYSTLSTFWSAIQDRLPEMCKVANQRRFGLLSPVGVKSLHGFLAAFLRYSYQNPTRRFRTKYGSLSLAEILKQPLADTLDTAGSYLREHTDSEQFWRAGGPWKRFGSSYKGITALTDCLWNACRQPTYSGNAWTRYLTFRARVARSSLSAIEI